MAPQENVDHLEKRVNEFVNQVNKRLDDNSNKLDMLVDLTRHMAVLQEKQDHNADHMHDIEKKYDLEFRRIEERNLKSDMEKQKTVERLHHRIDAVEAAADVKAKEVAAKVTKKFEDIIDDMKKSADKVDTLEDDYKGKVNFFRGIFFAFALFSAVGQGMLYKYFADIEKNISESRVLIQKIENRFNETERQIDIIHNSVRSLKK